MTKIGALIHSIGLILHIHHKPAEDEQHTKQTVAETVRELADDIAAVSIIYTEVSDKVKDIKDPIEKTKAIAAEIVARKDEIPQDIKDSGLEEYIVSFCQHVTALPLDMIQKAIQEELDKLKS